MEVTPRLGAARGAVVALAAASVTIVAVSLSMPASLLHVIGPPPVPRVFAIAMLPLVAVAGALVGSRASRAPGSPSGRRARVARLAGAAYLGTVIVVAASLRVATLGAETLAVPLQLLLGGVMACVLFLPWAAAPVVAATLALEAWTRPRGAAPRG